MTGLAASDATTPDWTVARAEDHPSDDLDWFHTWTAPGGQVAMRVAGAAEHYVLEFPGLARFSIDFARHRISAHAASDCTSSTLAHLLLDQVLPRAICHEGRMVVHASAVALRDGRAIAFAGVSGRGKSTLAAAFYRAGYRLLADDCLLLERRDAAVFVIPAYGSMRLWPTAADALFAADEQRRMESARMAHYADKRMLRPSPEGEVQPKSEQPLKALFLLEPPAATSVDDGICVEKTGGMSTIMALVESQFALDVADRAAVRRNFTAVREIAGHVPVYRLCYPHDFDRLDQVLEAVLRAAERPKS